jgi:hypothetical protein
MQMPEMQTVQPVEHDRPSPPQAPLVLPGWQTLLESQQPLLQLIGSQLPPAPPAPPPVLAVAHEPVAQS